MARTIKIKRSTTPSSLENGELAYSSNSDIAGKLYVDHAAETLTANSAIIVDSDSKIDVDNLQLNGNSITSTNVDGNVTITPNSGGKVIREITR